MLKTTGQTGRNLKQRYSEYVRYIRYKDTQSAYANHIQQHTHTHTHTYGPLQNTKTLIHRASKRRLVDILNNCLFKNIAISITLIQKQIPVENTPLFTLISDVNLRSASD
jgi:hypothetical protein